MHYTSLLTTYNQDFIPNLVDQALKEDIQDGDHTTLATVPPGAHGAATLYAQGTGVIAGISLAEDLFSYFSPELTLEPHKQDGDGVSTGETIFTISGPVQGILTGERLVLNFIQHLSGIATKTRMLSQQIEDYPAALLDTRKTTPGLRVLEKWAVGLGGAVNHRLGLFDMIMLKDNHIDHAGGMNKGIQAVKDYLKAHDLSIPIVIEARSLEEVSAIIQHEGIKRILLDNMSPETMKEAISLINGQMQTEASGGVDADNLRRIAETGVDYISTSELTRGITPLDVSLKID